MCTCVHVVRGVELFYRVRERTCVYTYFIRYTQVGWYNAVVLPAFHLPYDDETVAWLVISQPSMFEKLFVPYLRAAWKDGSYSDRDPLDSCLYQYLNELIGNFRPQFEVDVIQDYDMHPDRRPKVLVQTAGHIAGAAYYYQRHHVDKAVDPWDESKKIFGVSVHPKFGGWFAFRGVLIFKGLTAPSTLVQTPPPDCVPTPEMKIDLLHRFNECWQDWTYRDVCGNPAQEVYSDKQKLYFGTLPKERRSIIEQILSD